MGKPRNRRRGTSDLMQGYEKMVSSFALVSANLLIVNIFLKQLGQQEGSQYSTL